MPQVPAARAPAPCLDWSSQAAAGKGGDPRSILTAWFLFQGFRQGDVAFGRGLAEGRRQEEVRAVMAGSGADGEPWGHMPMGAYL